jgi:hypothetical protein
MGKNLVFQMLLVRRESEPRGGNLFFCCDPNKDSSFFGGFL